ncbi:MAG: RDD family protein, partial [Stackebrandtia sp.]
VPDRPDPLRPADFGRPSPQRVAELTAGRTLANPGLRLAARLIDIVAVAGLNAVVNGWFVYQYLVVTMPVVQKAMADPSISPADLELPPRAEQLFVTMLVIALLLWFVYEVPSTVNSGQTLGKRVVGIKVAPIYDKKLRYSGIISRWSLMILPVACFPFAIPLAVMDGIWCLFDRPFKQCLHDKFAATMVVEVPAETSSTTVKGEADGPPDPR